MVIQTSGKDSSEEPWKNRKLLLLRFEEGEEIKFSSLLEDVMRSKRRDENETNDKRRLRDDDDAFFSRCCSGSGVVIVGFVVLGTNMDTGRGRRCEIPIPANERRG